MASYKHTGITRTVTSKELGRQILFTANITAIINDVTLRLALTGTTTGKVTVYIADNGGAVISQRITATVTATTADITIQGLKAYLNHGMAYSLFIIAEPIPNTSMPGVHHVSTPTVYAQTLVITDYKLAASPWVITTTAGFGFPIGGIAGYQAMGDCYRSLDVGSVPNINGNIQIVMSESVSYPMLIDAYYTNDAALFAAVGVVGWLSILNVKTGDTVPPARYWRFHIQMQSNAAHDLAPTLDSIGLYFDGAQTIFTNRTQLIDYPDGTQAISGVPVLDGISSMSSQLTNKADSVFTGKLQATFSNDSRALGLLSDAPPMVGRRAHIQFGYDAVVDRVRVFDGTIEDVRYSQKKITLLLSDNIKYANVSIPKKDSYKSWDKAVAYAVGQLVTHQFFTWKAKTANTGIAPNTSPTDWQQITFPKVYDITTNNGQPWHLVDIVLDILRNEINIDDNRINFAAFDQLRALRVGYIGTRTLIKPEKAMKTLGELAWLLEAQWVQLSEGVSLIPDLTLADPMPQEIPHINDNDIGQGSFTYRRGWKELINECLIFSQWDGKAYQSATSYADAASISALRVVQQEVGHDRWNMPPAILDTIAKNVVTRKNNARRTLSFTTSGRNMRLECGDRVTFESSLLPACDPQLLHCVVVKKDIVGWVKQQINITLKEIL